MPDVQLLTFASSHDKFEAWKRRRVAQRTLDITWNFNQITSKNESIEAVGKTQAGAEAILSSSKAKTAAEDVPSSPAYVMTGTDSPVGGQVLHLPYWA